MDRTPPPVAFPSMATKHQLCPAFALSSYLEKSSQLPHKNSLFAHPKSGLPLHSGRLSYWIAKAIFTFDSSNKGTAHDCRKFGHSLAFTRGILPKTILAHGFWTTINVFIHKYLVPVEEPSYLALQVDQSHKILNLSRNSCIIPFVYMLYILTRIYCDIKLFTYAYCSMVIIYCK